MVTSFVTAVVAMCVLVSAWLAIQFLCVRESELAETGDPLAGRVGCQGCRCESRCLEEANLRRNDDESLSQDDGCHEVADPNLLIGHEVADRRA